ncbi:unnamed protein product [Gongylonema pulchrum]|uniref:ATP-dependent RNA helicase n=1 Tax=Gongylonema pulchrum TaxID=637853 RepID=A0A183D0X2_9BILA|nr:unnamed protein product [Gongylonema pulchrum]
MGLWGTMNQTKRLQVFHKFNNKTTGAAMIATDVASRGLDFARVDWVVQLDCPADVDDYIHRSYGLAMAPRVRFLRRTEKRAVKSGQRSEKTADELLEMMLAKREQKSKIKPDDDLGWNEIEKGQGTSGADFDNDETELGLGTSKEGENDVCRRWDDFGENKKDEEEDELLKLSRRDIFNMLDDKVFN